MSARNYYIMQSAVAPMQSELPCYTPLTNHRTEVHTVPLVMAADYAALEAENARLRVKLMAIASAEPARHGIEWAKAIAAEGNSEPYAKWREAIEERDALAAELAAIKGQQPVAFYWQDIGYPEPRKHGPYFGWPSESALRNVDGGAIPVPLYALPHAPRAQEGT